MFEELVCTKCLSKLRREGEVLRCQGCGISFEIKDGIPLMWQSEFDDNPLSSKMIAAELEFSKEFVGQLKDRPGIVGGAEEFYLRNVKESWASKKLDGRGFSPLFELAPEVFSNLPNLKILNIGCGWGKDAEWLIKNGAKDLVCSDISLDFIKIARERFEKYQIKPRYYFQANAEFLPILDNSFDMVFISSVLHHIPRPFLFLKQAARVAPIIATTLESSDMGIFKHILRFVGWNREYANLATHRLNIGRIKAFMEALGYTTGIKTDFVWFPFGVFKNQLDNKLFVDAYYAFLSVLSLFFGRWGHNFTMVARRRNAKIR